MFDIGDPGRSGRTATLVFPFSRVSFYRFGSDVFWASCAAFRPPVRFPRWVDVLFRAGCVGSQYSSGSVPHCDLEKQWRFTGQTVRGYRRIHEITRNTGFPCRIASTYNRKREPSRSWWRPVSPVCWRLRTRREPNLRGPLEPYAGDVIFFFLRLTLTDADQSHFELKFIYRVHFLPWERDVLWSGGAEIAVRHAVARFSNVVTDQH